MHPREAKQVYPKEDLNTFSMSRSRYDEIKGDLIVTCENLEEADIEAVWALSPTEVDEDIGKHEILMTRGRDASSQSADFR